MKGVTECHRLMQENNTDRACVRLFIGCLTDKNTIITQSTNVTSMALHAAMFGYLSTVFKKSLIDPLDRAPNRDKTYKKIFKCLKDMFFIQPYDEVANGCATSMIEILQCTFPEFAESDYNLTMIESFIQPLLDLLPGGKANNYQTNAACFCLRKLVQYFIKDKTELVSYELANRIVTMAIVSFFLTEN